MGKKHFYLGCYGLPRVVGIRHVEKLQKFFKINFLKLNKPKWISVVYFNQRMHALTAISCSPMSYRLGEAHQPPPHHHHPDPPDLPQSCIFPPLPMHGTACPSTSTPTPIRPALTYRTWDYMILLLNVKKLTIFSVLEFFTVSM